MKVSSILLLMFFTIAMPASRASAQARADQPAQQSIEAWLLLIDLGKYAESWKDAAHLFQAHVTRGQWESALKATRLPLGKLQSRKIKNTTDTNTLPGAPDGQYVVIQYETSFEQKQSATETVTALLDKDGQWKVSGYYIK